MRERSATELLAAVNDGDESAWHDLVVRYERLVWSVTRSYRLDHAAAADVVQTVWLRLVEHCHRIREAEALPGWLATTTRNEALRTLRKQGRERPSSFELDVEDRLGPAVDERMVRDERQRELVAAFGHLSPACQQLLRLLSTDPPLDYETIGSLIERPVGSIGPTRARCLERLRKLVEAERAGPGTYERNAP